MGNVENVWKSREEEKLLKHQRPPHPEMSYINMHDFTACLYVTLILETTYLASIHAPLLPDKAINMPSSYFHTLIQGFK